MKNRSKNITKIFILCLFFLLMPTKKAFAEYKIYMALWRGWEDASQGFKDYLTSKDIDFKLIVRDADRNLLKIPEFTKEVKEIKPDLLVTWGTTMTLGMNGPVTNNDKKKYVTQTPSVFMVVSQPIEAGIINNYASSNRNITGATSKVDILEQVEKIKEYIPFRKMGVLYNAKEGNSLINIKRLRNLAKTNNFLLYEEKIPLNENKEPVVDSIDYLVARIAESKPDLIYLGTDSFLNKNRDILTISAIEKRIPVFSAGESAVKKSNALFSYSNRYYNVGQVAGKKAYQILKEKIKPKEIPVEAPINPIMTINMDVAKRLFMIPPLDILQKSDIVNY